ncbi:helix-turn-helix transcriptional regulator [Streptomyces sp. SID5910]|uniref:helix-turn-helix domain-containing protein n=1 Tax=Streptomyces sp. SID5910 TaxID=2690312 RepID=UPI001F394265|nr:helix-turn-helix transcriptional regulator [Streptomyces sp. SID5910]
MAEQGRRTDFSDLLRERRTELGVSLRDMAERCIDPQRSGEQAKFGWLSKVERGESVDPPKEERLRALAAGYQIPLAVLQAAATRQFFGYDPAGDASVVWSGDRTTRLIVARAEEMNEKDRQELAEIAEVMARRRAQRNSPGQGNSDD